MVQLKPIRVLIVEDSPDLAVLMGRMIQREPDLEEAGIVYSADGLAREVEGHLANVVLIDLTMPGTPPVRAIDELTRAQPACRVLAWSGYDDPQTITSAMEAGAHAYVSKSCGMSDIIAAIRKVARSDSTPA